MKETLQIVQAGHVMLLGDYIPELRKLKNPMLMNIIPTPKGDMGVNLCKLPYDPPEIEVGWVLFAYPATDTDLIAVYTQAVTGIVLAKAMPVGRG